MPRRRSRVPGGHTAPLGPEERDTQIGRASFPAPGRVSLCPPFPTKGDFSILGHGGVSLTSACCRWRGKKKYK